MLDHYRDRVVVAEIDANRPVSDDVDVALYDSFAQPESDHDEIDVADRQPAGPPGRRLHLELPPRPDRERAASKGRTATCPRRCPPATWSPRWRPSTPARSSSATRRPDARGAPVGLDWPGRGEGLTDREAEILALITQGKNNAEVAAADLPQPQHREVLHPHDLPQDRRRQPDPGGALGRRPRLHPGPPPHRPLARRTLTARHTGPMNRVVSAELEVLVESPARLAVQVAVAGAGAVRRAGGDRRHAGRSTLPLGGGRRPARRPALGDRRQDRPPRHLLRRHPVGPLAAPDGRRGGRPDLPAAEPVLRVGPPRRLRVPPVPAHRRPARDPRRSVLLGRHAARIHLWQ